MKLRQTILLLFLVLASCLLCFSAFSQIPTSGLVAYWPMNGNFTDAGPYSINGSNTGATATPDKFGAANKAMDFNNPGSTVVQYGTQPSNTNLNFSASQNFSIAFLFYMKSPFAHTGGFYDNCLNFGGPGVWIWAATGAPRVQFNFRNGNVGMSTDITPGLWYHVTCVKNGSTLSIYVNGLFNASNSVGTMTPAYSTPGRFGTMFYSLQSPQEYNGLHGKMDELRIYNRALSATEIAGLASTTLPLQLGELTAVRKTNAVELNWQTLSEQNTSHFEIEKSEDGSRFSAIGSVTAAGNSSVKKDYRFTDWQPSAGTAFYRLKMIDLDNAFQYSRIVAVKNNKGPVNVDVFPNPAADVVQVQIPSDRKKKVTLSVTGMSGQVLWQSDMQVSEGTNSTSIEVLRFPPGQYLLTVSDENGKTTTPFIRQ